MSYHLVPTRYVEVVTINETAAQKARFATQLGLLRNLRTLIGSLLKQAIYITGNRFDDDINEE